MECNMGIDCNDCAGCESQLEQTLYKVMADHCIRMRPDKYGLTKSETTAFADSLRPLGYENISITVDNT